MKASLRYAAASSLLLASIILALWYFLDTPGRHGVLFAAAVALPVQVGAFAVLVGCRAHVRRFLAAWAGGTVVRMGVLLAVAILALRRHMEGAIAMSLSLAGFFFLLLLLEPLYFRLELARGAGAR